MAKKNNEKMESENMDTDSVIANESVPGMDAPIKRLSDFTEEAKTARVSEELISILGNSLFDKDVVISTYSVVEGGLYAWSDIGIHIEGMEASDMIHVLTNSPTVAKKLLKVGKFPVLARFTRREVRGKFKYDLE